MKSHVVDGRYSDRIDAVRIAVEIALVAMICTVAASENKDRAFAVSTLVDTINHRLLN